METYTEKLLNQQNIVATLSIFAVVSQMLISSFREDIFDPLTDYIFPNLFKDYVIKHPGKRPLRIGLFARKLFIWILIISILAILF